MPVNEADPDRGINQAGYNSLGQKTVSINAAGDQSVTRYDYYGRDSLWVRPDGNTTFTYLTSGAAKGSVYQITSPVETRKYSYDSMGRITRTCDSINDTEKMAFAYEYDIYGRISRLTYPTGFSVTYHYNSLGYLYQVKNGSTNAVIWQGITSDARGNMTSYSLSENNISVTRAYNTAGFLSEIKTTVGGNARQWFEYQFETPTGNLTWRKDRIRNLTEDFTYDIHDRLTIAKGTGRDSLVMTYDDTGNMLSKSDVGTYSYNSERVHAVENVDSSADTTMFGNQRIVYNYMNLPEYIATDNDSLVYTYGIGTQRIKAALYNSNGQLVRTTWYGNGFERVVESTTEKFYHWIQSPVGTVALVVKVTGGSTTTYYLCGDNLGSLTGIMDSSGTMTGEYSYDAWGRRRSPSDWSYNVTDPNITFRGYTGHEHLDAFGLIHMNGRIYDPHLARVLNPDPVIQDMENIQAYNRYSYCLNNPLKYIDPSGYVRSNPTIRQDEKFLVMMEEWDRYEKEGMSYGGSTYSPYGWFLRPGEVINGVYYDGDSQSFRLVDDPSMVISRSEAIAIAMGEKTVGSRNSRYGYYEYVNVPLSYYPTGLSKPLPDEQGLHEIGEVVISLRFVPFTGQNSVPAGQGGENFSLAGMYLHFQVGGTKPMTINSASLDFSGTSQRQLGLTGMKQGESREGNLFKTGINAQSLAFGRLEFTYQGNNQFSITNNMFDFDYQAGQSFSRNAGTILGGDVNYNVFPSLLLRSPIPTLVPMIFGGPYNVIFNGNVTIPQ